MSEVNLPDGWTLTTLENVATWGSGGTPSRSEPSYYEGDIPWVKTGDLGPRVLYKASEFISELAIKNSSAKFFPKGSVAIAMYGATIGKTSILGIDATTNQACGVGNPIEGITFSEFLYYFLNNEKDNFIAKGKGGAQPNISQALIKEHPIPLPPLAEQKIIADKLDTLLAQVETTKARLERVPEILKSFRQSVLAAAVSGKLTEEWRNEFNPNIVDVAKIADQMFDRGVSHSNFGKKLERANTIDTEELSLVHSHVDGWELTRIGAICKSVVPNRDKPKNFSGGFHWLLTPHFDEKSIWIDYSKIESGLSANEVVEYNAKVIPAGNVIMTCVGRVGLSAVLEEDAVINQQLHAFIINKSILAEYLAYCIRANIRYFEVRATSTTISYLNKTSCNSLPIPLPSIEEQTEIVRRVEELFAYADRIEQAAQAAQSRVNNLTQSILAKAFRGELTADWRIANPDLISGDNSAEALLAKIKARRAKLAKKNKAKA